VFCTDALKNVLIFISVKAAQGIATEDCSTRIAASALPSAHNVGEHSPHTTTPQYFYLAALAACSMRLTVNLEKSSLVMYAINVESASATSS
jgi:hypothetical protein